MKIKEKKDGEIKMTVSAYEFAVLLEVLGNLNPTIMKMLDLDKEQKGDVLNMYSDIADFWRNNFDDFDGFGL